MESVMKPLVIFVGFVTLCAGHAILTIPGDNSHYVEGESRYVWMPTDDGTPVLVDLHEPADESFLMNRNGANNEYWLFTRLNPLKRKEVIVFGNATTIQNSNYRGNRPVKIIVHGWSSDGNSEVNPLLTAAFLSVLDCNVIVVNFREVAAQNYISAVAGAPSVGQFLGNFLMWLFHTAGGNWDTMHVVGYSLGAHVAGIAGRQTGGRPSRVTGLDPAGPSWGGNVYTLTVVFWVFSTLLLTLISTTTVAEIPNLDFGLCVNIWEAELSSCRGLGFLMGTAVMNKRGSGIYGLITGSRWPY